MGGAGARGSTGRTYRPLFIVLFTVALITGLHLLRPVAQALLVLFKS